MHLLCATHTLAAVGALSAQIPTDVDVGLLVKHHFAPLISGLGTSDLRSPGPYGRKCLGFYRAVNRWLILSKKCILSGKPETNGFKPRQAVC